MIKIKLKAWHIKEKRFIDLNGVDINFKGCLNEGEIYLIYEQGVLRPCPIEDIELLQFTGRTNKKGTEIYEGDILKSLHFIEGKRKHYLYHRVEWCDRLTGWQTISRDQKGTENNGNPQLWVYLKNTDCEVIGNIHLNPELLES